MKRNICKSAFSLVLALVCVVASGLSTIKSSAVNEHADPNSVVLENNSQDFSNGFTGDHSLLDGMQSQTCYHYRKFEAPIAPGYPMKDAPESYSYTDSDGKVWIAAAIYAEHVLVCEDCHLVLDDDIGVFKFVGAYAHIPVYAP